MQPLYNNLNLSNINILPLSLTNPYNKLLNNLPIIYSFILPPDKTRHALKQMKQSNRIIYETLYLQKYINADDVHNTNTLIDIQTEILNRSRYVENIIRVCVMLGKVDVQGIQTLRRSVHRVFPINGHDVIKCGITGSKIRMVLSKAQRYWIQQDFQPNKEQMLQYILALIK